MTRFPIAVLSLVAASAVWAQDSLSPDNPELTFTSGPHVVSNPLYPDVPCAQSANCDDVPFSVEIPAEFLEMYPSAQIRVTAASAGDDDFDLYLLDESGNEIQSSAGAENPERVATFAAAGMTGYTARIVPWLATGGNADIRVSLDAGAPADPDAVASAGRMAHSGHGNATDGLPPRYQVHVSPPEVGNDSGEPTLGYNPKTGRAMFVSYVNALRVTFPENVGNPMACDATWENKSGTITQLNSLDPIMTTDQTTGRTFNSQLSGANSLFEFSDDDGETWSPGQIGPPNGGADHQGLVAGPYPAGFPTEGLLYPNAIYYCSQSVASAFCARSDDGGQTFGPGMPVKNADCAAGALHGHPKVAPDGTVYVPDASQCVLTTGVTGAADNVVAFVSEDAGTTWAARPIPGSLAGGGGTGSDPSIGIATDGTVYMCYANDDDTMHMAVSHDKGLTWENDQDLGISAGLIHTRFPAAIAGDPDRASCAFLGTTTAGDSESLDYTGVWYPYVATTYDGGETYHLVNVSPNDPVQGHGGICGSGTCRNLLDFNDMEIDEQGRTLFAYADGCVGGCVIDPSQNSFASKGTIARQVGGRSLFAEFDDAPGTRYNSKSTLPPARACMSATASERTIDRTLVSWNAPDNGGDPGLHYTVLRSTSPDGPFEMIGSAGIKTHFVDQTADTSVDTYYYQVVAENAAGTAAVSNTIDLPITEGSALSTCSLPGAMIAIDPIGDGGVPDTDIEYFAVAEPAAFAGNFVFTLKIASFTAGEPAPTTFFPVMFPSQDGLYVAFDASQGLPRFVYGSVSELPQGLLLFTEEGTLDPASTYSSDGTVVMVVPKSLFGNPEPGSVIAGFDVRARAGAPSATSRDTAGPADYIVRGSDDCAADGKALATLGATRTSGDAPITVEFTVSGQAADGASLASFSLDFGDGQKVVDRAFDGRNEATISHTYRERGVYRAKAEVTDSKGNHSANLAEQTIELLGVVSASGRGFGTRGGAVPLWTLMLLLGAAGLRRRRTR